MTQIVAALAAFAEAIGGPGLLLIAFLDSSFLSFPQANDLLIILMVIKNPDAMPYYATMATLGSVAGCVTLHAVAAKGGEPFLRKRVRGSRIDRATGLIRRHGLLAVLIPAILPPPAPFKLFVLLAGIAGIPRGRFAIAVAAGRGFRYFGQGLLAVWYGEEAIAYLRIHGRQTFLVAAVVAASIGGLALLWRRWRSAERTLAI